MLRNTIYLCSVSHTVIQTKVMNMEKIKQYFDIVVQGAPKTYILYSGGTLS